MNTEFLEILYFKIIPKSIIPFGTNREELIYIADSIQKFYHIQSTATFSSEKKSDSSGRYWEHKFAFLIPSYAEESVITLIEDAGAIVIYTDIKTLVLFQNDQFVNTSFYPKINSDANSTEITITRTSLHQL